MPKHMQVRNALTSGIIGYTCKSITVMHCPFKMRSVPCGEINYFSISLPGVTDECFCDCLCVVTIRYHSQFTEFNLVAKLIKFDKFDRSLHPS